MANHAVRTQLPIMVRRPRAVWPGLDRMDLHRKQIAGDGNCLFASLADQLYGHPDKHLEIRNAVIDHMRTYRPLFESFAIKDDIQQKRATRAATNAIRNSTSEDSFEDYLAIMCKSGTYGGEPELMAFVQSYDQDVLVHLPRMDGYPESIPYINQYRADDAEIKPRLHLCYGGDEVTFPHYDSARRNTPVPNETPLIEQSKQADDVTSTVIDTTEPVKILTPRAIRSNRSDLSRDLMHDMIIKGSKEFRTTFEDSDRARSPSVTSSHHSSSSKRSFEDDGETQRASKRADRRKSTRMRGKFENNLLQPKSIKLRLSTHSQPATPQSILSSDDSSDQSDQGGDHDAKSSQEPESFSISSQDVVTEPREVRRSLSAVSHRVSTESLTQSIIAERRRSAVQT